MKNILIFALGLLICCSDLSASSPLNEVYQEGLSLLETGQPTQALARLRKAFYERPYQPALRTAYFLALKEAKTSSPHFVFERITSLLPLSLWVLLLSLSLGFCIYWSFSKKKAHLFYLTCLPFAFGLIWNLKYESMQVMTLLEGQSLKVSPSRLAKEVSFARKGALVNFKLRKDDWVLIDKNKHQSGWINIKFVYPSPKKP